MKGNAVNRPIRRVISEFRCFHCGFISGIACAGKLIFSLSEGSTHACALIKLVVCFVILGSKNKQRGDFREIRVFAESLVRLTY